MNGSFKSTLTTNNARKCCSVWNNLERTSKRCELQTIQYFVIYIQKFEIFKMKLSPYELDQRLF